MNTSSVTQRTLSVLRTKPYECFFGVLVLLFFAPIIAAMALLSLKDPAMSLSGNIITSYLAILGTVGIMFNLGEPKTSAKELFWLWIGASVIFTALAFFGYYEVKFFMWLSR